MIKTSRDNHGLSVSKFIARTKRMKDAICVRVIKLRKYEVPEYEYKKKNYQVNISVEAKGRD